VKIAHLADVHLGFRQYHRQTAGGINQREADVANALRAVIDGVLAAAPDAIVVAGDLFHAVRPTNAAIIFAFRQFQRLRAALPTVPIVVIAGNHDTPRSSETGSILRLYEELGVDVALDEAKRFAWPALDLSVLAVPHQALRTGERPVLRPDGGARHQVLLLHGEVEGVYPQEISGAAWGGVLLRREELRADDWSYVALGHYHVQHQVEPRVWYAGALEYVSSNPWGERRDEDRRGVSGKGWLLVDLDSGRVERRPVPAARRVIDLPALHADATRIEDLDRLLKERLAEIPGGHAEQIVRQVVWNVPREVARRLDHAAIRAVKAATLHYQLDLRRPDAGRGIGVDPAGHRQPLAEVLRDYLARRPLPADLDRDAFVRAGTALLEAVVRDEEG
jgi:DNA repair exonuclease SbcCD nuclease subunit